MRVFDSKSLITYNDPKSPISEAYRVLRTNIQYSSIDDPLKVIVVTSSGPGEGKSTTVANLAITFSQMGSRVLLIDADLRKPKIHKVFGLQNQRGLTNFLASREDYKNYVRNILVSGLNVITCGVIPPNPSELLASNAMKQFIAQVRDDYDIILIDAPPVGTVTDAAIISAIVDGTILVAASGSVEEEPLIRSKELLTKVNANIIGVVLNKLDKNSHGNNYYYNNYYYEEEHSGKTSRKSHRRMQIVKNVKKTR